MTCASCVQIIEDNAKKMSGVDSIIVNFATEKAELIFKDDFDESLFFNLMIKLGYRAVDQNQNAGLENKIFLDSNFYKSLFSIFVGIISMALSMGAFSEVIEHTTNNYIQFGLATFIIFFFGKIYLRAVYYFLKSFSGNMNTLIGLGIMSAYTYSVALMTLKNHGHVYFEAIPFIIGFTYLGHFLESKAKTKARSALSSLYKMQIKFAAKMIDGIEVSTAVIELKVGDIIRLRPGDKIPLDGEVIEGVTHTDESMISGESDAVVKQVGDLVLAGSLNLDGSIKIKVKQEIHQTYISNIVAFVEAAQMKKAPIQKYADNVVRLFVPVLIFIASLTFVVWWFLNLDNRSYQAFSHMISVFLIACPCALGLAVPMAVMLGTTEASKAGLLISGGDVIEKGAKIDIVVFDKTGTLTQGQPKVVDVIYNGDQEEFYKIVGSVVQYSTHPLSKAIYKFIESKKCKISDPDKFKDIPGAGFISEIEGKKIIVGSAQFLKSENISLIESELIGSLVYVSIDQKYCGLFVIADSIKVDAKQTIKQLLDLGLEVWMVSGDNQKIAKKIADELGIINVMSEVAPEDKAHFILKLQSNGKNVAMVGDGINDAPALSSSNLSMAMSSGSDVAIEASDVIILDGKLESVVAFFKISRKTMSIIKQNLFFSFIYNLLCIPLAAGAFYPVFKLSLSPMWASLAMSLSSLSVILSSLRLKKSI